jgi:hypothetical protein
MYVQNSGSYALARRDAVGVSALRQVIHNNADAKEAPIFLSDPQNL